MFNSIRIVITLFILAVITSSCTNDSTVSKPDFFDVIKKRRSVRKYKSTPVPQEHIEKILNAGRLAPTAGNQQPWKFVVIQDSEKLEELKEECVAQGMKWISKDKNLTPDEMKKREERMKGSVNNYLSAPVFFSLGISANLAHFRHFSDC